MLTLTNFCGKTLQTESLAMTALASSRLLHGLSSDGFALCRGVDVNNVTKGNALNLIREYVEDELVVRSKDCNYVIMLSEAQVRANLYTMLHIAMPTACFVGSMF